MGCASCDRENVDHAKFCSDCGGVLLANEALPSQQLDVVPDNCGAEIDNSSRYCGVCGKEARTAKVSSRFQHISTVVALGLSGAALMVSALIYIQGGSGDGRPRQELSPVGVFNDVSSSVFVVEVLDGAGEVTRFGSGVAIGQDRIVTNKHVIEGETRFRVRQGPRSWPARVLRSHPDKDLSELEATGLSATSVTFRPASELHVGERVYAIGAPQGLERSLSEGIVSNTWDEDGLRLIQTTAAISEGSSGGGLFDSIGRLVGITTSYIGDGQNLNFALPVEAINSLPAGLAYSNVGDVSKDNLVTTSGRKK